MGEKKKTPLPPVHNTHTHTFSVYVNFTATICIFLQGFLYPITDYQ